MPAGIVTLHAGWEFLEDCSPPISHQAGVSCWEKQPQLFGCMLNVKAVLGLGRDGPVSDSYLAFFWGSFSAPLFAIKEG